MSMDRRARVARPLWVCLTLAATVALAACTPGSRQPAATGADGRARSALAMIRVPLDKVCDYRTIAILDDKYLQRNGRFDPAFLDKADSCGTKVLIGLSNQTRDILGRTAGLTWPGTRPGCRSTRA
jgi:hypothetical protein